ncbi:MAG: DUF2846 domain-containing protein [Myxococcota bacterium]
MSNPPRGLPCPTARPRLRLRPRPDCGVALGALAPCQAALRDAALAALALGILALGLLAGCASDPATGPAFVAATQPPEGHARVFVFRIDPQHSLSNVDLALDERDAGRLRNREYVAFDLLPGIHRLDFRQRGLAFASWGWNRQQLRLHAGETVYLEISVRMSAQPLPGAGQDLEIQGRTSGSASENVFIQRRTEVDALPILADTTLRVD